MPLLTLHRERIIALVEAYIQRHSIDGNAIAGHWLTQHAISDDVITWDRAVWGDLQLSVGFSYDDEADGQPTKLEIAYLLAAEGPWLTAEIEAADVAVGEGLPDPTQKPADFLELVTVEFNNLHERTRALVRGWPETSGVPLV